MKPTELPQDKAQQELCLLKEAIKALLRQNPEGLEHSEICRRLQQNNFPRTYRNLHFLTSAVLELLLGEGKIVKSTTHDSRYMIHDSKKAV